MKRVLALLSLVCALALASACHSDVNLSVDASADLMIIGADILHIPTTNYTGFHRISLSDEDLEWIFTDLIKQTDNHNFQTAKLYLSIFDEISNKHLRDEVYSVVYNSLNGHYDFADMDIVY